MENQKGRWSDWFNNVGNRDYMTPKDYKGRRDIACEVVFCDGEYISGKPINIWRWECRDPTDPDVRSITKYRYWIPEEDTSWTEEDQKELEHLEQKRKSVTEAQDRALKKVLNNIDYDCVNETGDYLSSVKHHAKQLIKALKPFVKD
jgi:hypothetical protein